ncbi:MAG: hypothetical protein VW268_04450 [Rhodospirillaceae bacterium]
MLAISDRDVHLFETLAICVYIDEEYTADPQLQPRDAIDKADMFQRISLYLDEGYRSMIAGCVILGMLMPVLGIPAYKAKVQENLPKA